MGAGFERYIRSRPECQILGCGKRLGFRMRATAGLRPAATDDATVVRNDDASDGGIGRHAPKPSRGKSERMTHMGDVVHHKKRLVAFAALQFADQRLEVLRLAEIPVHGGEADIGDLIETRKRLHHELADHGRGNLVLAHALESAHDARYHTLDPFALDGALAQRVTDGAFELVSLEGLSTSVLLDDHELAQLDTLDGREATAAFRAMPAAPDRRILLRRTTVLHLCVVMSAERAAHGGSISSLAVSRREIAGTTRRHALARLPRPRPGLP